ncbi:ABC transporter substrate-binding protein [Parafrankia sp. EUN1f]|uniref:ABC transporter substrate-binding protein n=1 Tax=Parafrankia sp. EUN1f TaxID=102897 RepID=UPI0001C44E9E|nr:ABC transporter substrate-binding protein [Parafrankia sp. EUN1f]EFC82454.1 ABC-type branched-chain amino acid transport systems periplasmic component-like protein [Parafrankia sp. EUN1f]
MRARALVAGVVLSSLALVACGSRAGDSAPSGEGTQTGAASANTASDTGVTPTEIKIGNITGMSGGLGPETFSASLYGARAYFKALNAKGGVNGRKVTLVSCDDKSTGDDNVACAHKLVDDEKVFALAGVTAFDYAGGQYINSEGVPDIGGQPVGVQYDQYPHLYSIYGSDYPRDGRRPGFDGNLYGGTEEYRWYKEKLGATTAAVVYYSIAQSERYATKIANGLRAEGYKVVEEPINLAAPNWDSVAQHMKQQGVQIVFDAMEDTGNAKLCESMERQGVPLKAKVTTAQGMSSSVGTLYSSAPQCRNLVYATTQSATFSDASIPAVKAFQDAITTYEPDRAATMNQWMLEGYASAQWLTDAMASCGANLTRECVETYMNRNEPYTGNGLLTARDFVKDQQPPAESKNCLNVARWQDSANGGKGGWLTQSGDMNTNCYTVKNLPYPAA